MDLQAKTPRKRVVNFTTDEKALLAQIIKNKPIIESKLTDGKSIAKKHVAWESVTREFNCHGNVHKRETYTLKRAWDNMKAWTRKTRAAERGNLIRTGGGPSLLQDGAISMVEDAAPVLISEINNIFDSDGAILSTIDNQEMEGSADKNEQETMQANTFDIITEELKTAMLEESPILNKDINTKQPGRSCQSRKTADYIQREAVLRIKNLENKKRMEFQILKTRLEVEEVRKRAALLEEERNKILLEKAKIELDLIKSIL